ncbi:MAG TPA: tetratricopeptide repeat protein [Candidatus Acidoferrum sp.]|nr:tetratricopeptide repeat protein [Candidatus Acidoferrum sp.]
MARIHLIRGVLFLAVLFSVAHSKLLRASDSPAVAVTGTIFSDANNARIVNADAALCDAGGAVLQQSTADDSGQFSFQGLRPGRYILKVQANGFQSTELPLDLSYASQHGLSVRLRPMRNSDQPHSDGMTVSVRELAIPDGARELLDSGKRKLYSEKNGEAALRDFQSAIKTSPNFYEAYYLAGMAYLSLQNSGEAEKHFRKSVDLSQKKYADANIALGSLLLQRGEDRSGEDLLRQGLASNPHSWPGQFALGELELTRGHVQPALAAAQQAAELAPAQPVVYRLLAIIHLRQKNYSALLTDLDAYLQLDPDSPAGLRAKELRAQAEKQLLTSPGATVSANK